MDEDNSIFKNIKYEESKNYGPPVYSDSDVLEDNEQTTNDFVNELDGILMDLQKSKSWRVNFLLSVSITYIFTQK